jgi:hypothetical protein
VSGASTGGHGWRLAPRVERLRASQSYALVLILIGVTIAFLFRGA